MRGVIGHRRAQELLQRAARSGQVHHAYLLTGPAASGKTTLALAFAATLQCTQPTAMGDACGTCAMCLKIAHGNAPDVTLVEPAQNRQTLGVESVRDVLRAANLAPSESPWRIFILPDVEKMTIEAVNALLKTLEEPPPGVVLLLTSAEPDALLPTLLSRCQVVALQPLAPDEVAAALRELVGASHEEAATLAALANGRLGWALRAHEHPELREWRADELRTVASLPSATRDVRLRHAATLAADGPTARRVLELWTLWWRDVVLAANGATHLATTGEPRVLATQLGQRLGAARAHAFLLALLAAQSALDQNANPRLTFEVLLLDLPMIAGATGTAR